LATLLIHPDPRARRVSLSAAADALTAHAWLAAQLLIGMRVWGG
jgi:hypothetical protein